MFAFYQKLVFSVQVIRIMGKICPKQMAFMPISLKCLLDGIFSNNVLNNGNYKVVVVAITSPSCMDLWIYVCIYIYVYMYGPCL